MTQTPPSPLHHYKQLTVMLHHQLKTLRHDLESAREEERHIFLAGLINAITAINLEPLHRYALEASQPQVPLSPSIDSNTPAFLRHATGISLGRLENQHDFGTALMNNLTQAQDIQAWLRSNKAALHATQLGRPPGASHLKKLKALRSLSLAWLLPSTHTQGMHSRDDLASLCERKIEAFFTLVFDHAAIAGSGRRESLAEIYRP